MDPSENITSAFSFHQTRREAFLKYYEIEKTDTSEILGRSIFSIAENRAGSGTINRRLRAFGKTKTE